MLVNSLRTFLVKDSVNGVITGKAVIGIDRGDGINLDVCMPTSSNQRCIGIAMETKLDGQSVGIACLQGDTVPVVVDGLNGMVVGDYVYSNENGVIS